MGDWPRSAGNVEAAWERGRIEVRRLRAENERLTHERDEARALLAFWCQHGREARDEQVTDARASLKGGDHE